MNVPLKRSTNKKRKRNETDSTHISVAAALYQLPRVARFRGVSEAQIRPLIDAATEDRQFGILGEPRVNVLKLNLLLKEEGIGIGDG
jgi:K+-transporting ATPase c subunit